jgi:hypothetical protein
MTYVVINSGNLAGPPRAAGGGDGVFTQWGAGGVFGRGSGRRQLGAVPQGFIGVDTTGFPDSAKREVLASAFNVVVEGWRTQLQTLLDEQFNLVNGLKAANPFTFKRARDNLLVARDAIRSQVVPSGTTVIRDASLPLSVVQQRVREFLVSYAGGVDAQIRDAQVQAQRATFVGQANVFMEAFSKVVVATSAAIARTVVNAVEAGAEELDKSPTTTIVLAVAAAALLYWKFGSRSSTG